MRKYASYLTLASSTGLAQGFLLLVAPLVTRLYGPEDLGAFGIVLGVGALIASLGTGRLEHAVPVADSNARAVQVALLGGVMIAFFSALVMVALLGVYRLDLLASFSAMQDFPLLAVPAIALSLGVFQLVTALLLRQRSYRSVGGMKLHQGGWTGNAQLLLGWAALGPSGLIWAQALGYAAASGYGVRKVLPRVRAVLRLHGLHLKETFLRFRRFPLMLAPAALLNQATQHLPVLALGYIFSLYEAGLYALVMRVCGAPLGLLGQAVAQVYAAEFRSYMGGRSGELAHQYLRMLLRLLALGCLAVGVIVLFMNLWGTWLFGERWANIGVVSLLLSPMLVMDFATTPISMTMGYVGRERLQLLWDVGRLVSVAGVFVVAQLVSLSHAKVLLLLASVWAASLLVHAVLTYRACCAVRVGGVKE